MTKKQIEKQIEKRPPIVVVMGHVDHGKSTLLDYIRKTNIVEKEKGGITQHISAYEVIQKDEKGENKKISFLDTPGHEAFEKMRTRGVQIADIAVLVVSAEDGVKMQTMEAYRAIKENNIPFIVAINKIDKPNANIEKTKIELAEKEIYLEGYGGNIPFALISAKIGTGVPDLLMLINILAEMENFEGERDKPAEGFVIEARKDEKRGIEATLIIKNGTLKKGMTVAVADSICSTRIMENFKGEAMSVASFSSPVSLVGFDKIPPVGAPFCSFLKKEDAIFYKENYKNEDKNIKEQNENDKKIIPIILKADFSGSIEAIEKEIEKIKDTNTIFKIISKNEGQITETDIKNISNEETIVIGFNVKIDKNATELADRMKIKINIFDIIYKITEFLKIEMENKRQKIEMEETIGKIKVLKVFSQNKDIQVLGGKVTEGTIKLGNVKIIRRDFMVGKGKITNLEKGKVKVNAIEEGSEFGMMLESKIEIAAGDILESFIIVKK